MVRRMTKFESMNAHQEISEEEKRAMMFDIELAHKHFMDSLR